MKPGIFKRNYSRAYRRIAKNFPGNKGYAKTVAMHEGLYSVRMSRKVTPAGMRSIGRMLGAMNKAAVRRGSEERVKIFTKNWKGNLKRLREARRTGR